jgi:hypothetical protein
MQSEGCTLDSFCLSSSRLHWTRAGGQASKRHANRRVVGCGHWVRLCLSGSGSKAVGLIMCGSIADCVTE